MAQKDARGAAKGPSFSVRTGAGWRGWCYPTGKRKDMYAQDRRTRGYKLKAAMKDLDDGVDLSATTSRSPNLSISGCA